MSVTPDKPLNAKEVIEERKLFLMNLSGKKMTRKQLLRGIELSSRKALASIKKN